MAESKELREIKRESLKHEDGFTAFLLAEQFHAACKRAYKTKAFNPVYGIRNGGLFYSTELLSKTDWIGVMFIDGEVQLYAVPAEYRPEPKLRLDDTPYWYSPKPVAAFPMCDPKFDAKLADRITLMMGKPMNQDWMAK